MFKRAISLILSLVLIAASIPICAHAADSYPLFSGTLQISDEGIEMIKDLEGFIRTPTWDVAQYSVGYGCSSAYAEKYGFDPSSMTKEEAHQLMLFVLDEMEESLDKFLSSYNIEVNQYQYDALMSFTYNLGKGSINATSRIGKLLKEGNYTVNQMASAFGIYCHTGTGKNAVVQDHLVSRRIREAKLFLYGAYDFEDVPEKFCRLTYAGNVPSSYSDVALYLQGSPYQTLVDADPSSDYAYGGLYFVGWYTADGKKVTAETIVEDNMTVYPMWSDQEDDPELELNQEPYVCANWKQLTEKTYVNGCVADHAPLTRGEMMQLIVDTMGLEYDEKMATEFTDVPKGSKYYEAVSICVYNEISAGMTQTTFLPDLTVTRAQAATFIYRSGLEAVTLEQVPTDVKANSYYFESVCSVIYYEIMSVDENNEFKPNEYVYKSDILIDNWINANCGLPYEILDIEIRNQNFDQISDIPQGSFFVDVSVKNVSSSTMDFVIIACYDGCGKMLDMHYLYSNIPIGQTAIFGVGMDNSNDEIKQIKTFVLSMLGSFVPLAESKEFSRE